MTAKKFLLLLLGAALIAAMAPAVTSGRGSGTRALEGLLEKEGFSGPEKASISRAYQTALRSGIDSGDAIDLVEVCLKGDFEGGQIERALGLSAQVALSGLPMERFISKIKEGVAKRADADTILEVSEGWALAMRRAENLLKQIVLEGHDLDDRSELLEAVADALAAGGEEAEIHETIVTALEKGERPRSIRRKILP